MPEIIKTDGTLAVCGCEASQIENQFEIIPHPELPKSPMAFCVHCEQGRALSQWQYGIHCGVITKTEFTEFKEKYVNFNSNEN